MMSTFSDHGSLEVIDEGPLEVLPGVDEVWFKASSQVRGADSKATGKYSAFVELDPLDTLMATE
jgi:hypothetical protein